MIGKCTKCGITVTRYGNEQVMNAPCEFCGSMWFEVLHLGISWIRGSYDHWVLLNLQTGERGYDPCRDGDLK